MVRSYSTGQQEPRPYSPPLPNNTMLSLHQDNSRPLIQDSLEEDNNLEEDNIRESLPQDRMDIEVSPPSPSPPSSRWSLHPNYALHVIKGNIRKDRCLSKLGC